MIHKDGELKICSPKLIARITICGALHIHIYEKCGNTDFIIPTPEQRKNLKEMLCIDVEVFDEKKERKP